MKKTNPLLILLACLLCCTACTKSPSLSSAAEQSCAEVDELFKLAINEDMINLSPDEFIEKHKNLLVLTSDKINYDAPPSVVRTLNFKPAKGHWLISAGGFYDDSHTEAPTRFILTTASFHISPSCIAPSQMAARLSQLIPAAKQSSPDRMQGFWAWDYVDPNNAEERRYISFSSYQDGIRISTGLRPNVDLSDLEGQESQDESEEDQSEEDESGEDGSEG